MQRVHIESLRIKRIRTCGRFSSLAVIVAIVATLLASVWTMIPEANAQQNPKLVKAFTPAIVSPNSPSFVKFTLINTPGNPARSGLGFSDVLPAPITATAPVTWSSSACSGTVTFGATVTLSGGTMTAGTSSCWFRLPIARPRPCGVYKNKKSSYTSATGLLTPSATVTLTVASKPADPCPESKRVEIRKVGNGIPAGTYQFTLACGNGNPVHTVSITFPTPGSAVSPLLTPGTTSCTLTEIQGTLPNPSPNIWQPPSFMGATPTVPFAATVTIGSGTTTTVTVTNSTAPNGQGPRIKLTKSAGVGETIPAGTYVFSVVCGNGNPPFTASITYPAPGTWVSPNLLPGTTSCVVTELAGSLPASNVAFGAPTFILNGTPQTSTGFSHTVAVTSNTDLVIQNHPAGAKDGAILQISKRPKSTGIPSGNYNFTVNCGPGYVFAVAIAYPNPGTWQSPSLPANITNCTVTEDQSTLPVGTGGVWNPPLYQVGNTTLANAFTVSVPLSPVGTITDLVVLNEQRPESDITSTTSTSTSTSTTSTSTSTTSTTTSTSTTTTTTTTLPPPQCAAAPCVPVLTKAPGNGAAFSFVFTITNPAGSPAQTGLGFVDTLPTNVGTNGANPVHQLTASSGSTSCVGATINASGSTVSLSGVNLPAGPSSCTVTVFVAPQCGTYVNGALNVVGSGGLVTSGVNATISTNPCGLTKTLTIEKISGMPTGSPSLSSYGTLIFQFTVLCGGTTYTGSVTHPTPGIWTINVPANTTSCVVTELQPLPKNNANLPVSWLAPTFSVGSPNNVVPGTGYSRTITLNATGNTLVIVANQWI